MERTPLAKPADGIDCPRCGHTLYIFECRNKSRMKPNPGDITCCAKCFVYLQFTEDGELKQAEAEQLLKADFSDMQKIRRKAEEKAGQSKQKAEKLIKQIRNKKKHGKPFVDRNDAVQMKAMMDFLADKIEATVTNGIGKHHFMLALFEEHEGSYQPIAQIGSIKDETKQIEAIQLLAKLIDFACDIEPTDLG